MRDKARGVLRDHTSEDQQFWREILLLVLSLSVLMVSGRKGSTIAPRLGKMARYGEKNCASPVLKQILPNDSRKNQNDSFNCIKNQNHLIDSIKNQNLLFD